MDFLWNQQQNLRLFGLVIGFNFFSVYPVTPRGFQVLRPGNPLETLFKIAIELLDDFLIALCAHKIETVSVPMERNLLLVIIQGIARFLECNFQSFGPKR